MNSPNEPCATDARETLRRVEQICDRFEAACKAGQRPRIEDYLPEVPAREQSALLRELILLEIDYRRLAGEHVHEGEILTRFPNLDRGWVIAALENSGFPEREAASGVSDPSRGLAETVAAP